MIEFNGEQDALKLICYLFLIVFLWRKINAQFNFF